MISNKNYLKQPKSFWAQVKLVSMSLGYSKLDKINVYSINEIVGCLKEHGLETDHLIDSNNKITSEGKLLVNYFKYRAETLKKVVEPNLMKRDEAKSEFEKLQTLFSGTIAIPYNKQKGEKRHYAYLTAIVNLLTEKTFNHANFDANPRKVVVITKNKKPLQTLTRRVDGVYPSTVNPIALWEIKEYYGTTTFGSRVADGVYETMLDGYEIEELRSSNDIDVKHYLIIDDYFTWWKCGKSYLCRIVDMVHEGFVDEVLFGKEVITRWPQIIKSWPKVTKSTVTDREHLLQP